MFTSAIYLMGMSSGVIREAKKGIVSLSIEDLKSTAQITGQWKFIFHKDQEASVLGYLNVPGSWKGKKFQGDILEGTGYAEYRLKINLPANPPANLAIKLNRIESAYRLIVNGEDLGGNGRVGRSLSKSLPERRTRSFSFQMRSEQEIDIRILVSNFRHPKGGMTQPLWIGTSRSINDKAIPIIEVLAVGVLLANSVLLLFLFVLKKERGLLHSFIFFLLISLYILCAGENLLLALVSMEWSLYQMILHLTVSLVSWSYSGFLRYFYSAYVSNTIYTIIKVAVSLYVVVVLFSEPLIYINLLWYVHIILIFAVGFWLYILIKAMINKEPGALAHFVGIWILAIAEITEILYLQEQLIPLNLVPLGLLFWGFTNLLVIALGYSKETKRAEVAELSVESSSSKITEIKERLNTYQVNPELGQIRQFKDISYIFGNTWSCTLFSISKGKSIEFRELKIKNILESGEFPELIQCSRNHLVHIEAIRKVISRERKSYLVLVTGEKLPLGNTYSQRIEEIVEMKPIV